MKLSLYRFSSSKESTLGIFYIDQVFQCFTLEDQFQTEKKYGETRISPGNYPVKLRTEGGFHNRYLEKFGPEFHKGMLCITNAPDWKLINNELEFQYVLFHIGNKDDDTAGCILPGNSVHENITEDGFVGSSTAAYKRIYPIIIEPLIKKEPVNIEIFDDIC